MKLWDRNFKKYGINRDLSISVITPLTIIALSDILSPIYMARSPSIKELSEYHQMSLYSRVLNRAVIRVAKNRAIKKSSIIKPPKYRM